MCKIAPEVSLECLVIQRGYLGEIGHSLNNNNNNNNNKSSSSSRV